MDVEKDVEADRGGGNSTPSSGTPEGDPGPRPDMIPVPDSPYLSAQLPSPRAPLDWRQHLESSPDKTCAPSRAPRADETQ